MDLLNFYRMPAEHIATVAESNAVCFLNTFSMRNDSPDMRECVHNNAWIITACAESNRVATIEAVVRAICDNSNVYDKSLSTILNLILYAGIYHQAHRFNYATNTATVYLTARDGYYYALDGVQKDGIYTWSYERRKAGY